VTTLPLGSKVEFVNSMAIKDKAAWRKLFLLHLNILKNHVYNMLRLIWIKG
jgi:hypothetical protein